MANSDDFDPIETFSDSESSSLGDYEDDYEDDYDEAERKRLRKKLRGPASVVPPAREDSCDYDIEFARRAFKRHRVSDEKETKSTDESAIRPPPATHGDMSGRYVRGLEKHIFELEFKVAQLEAQLGVSNASLAAKDSLIAFLLKKCEDRF